MERQASTLKSKGNKILKFLPKAAQAAVSFQNPPFSPGLEKKLRTPSSGPIFSMFPIQTQRGSKHFDTLDPTSPKVSCIGQVRHHRDTISKKSHAIRPVRVASIPARPELESPAPGLNKKPPRMAGIKRINNIFGSRRKSDACADDRRGAPPLTERAPSLSQMKRFASSRDALADFDWRTGELSTTPGAGEDYLWCNTDGGRDIVVMPFTVPIVVAGVRTGKGAAATAGVEPRKPKEINLWKRRAMVAQPPPLQLNLVRAVEHNSKNVNNKLMT